MEANGMTQYAGAAMFGFLAVGAVALFSFISVAHWLTLRAAERHSRDRFAMMKAILDHPGDHANRVLSAWHMVDWPDPAVRGRGPYAVRGLRKDGCRMTIDD